MAEPNPEIPLEKIARELRPHGVEFIVIGGQAESIYGSPHVTYDVDLCYRRSKENLDIGDIDLQVISLEDLIRIKQHLDRPKDRDSLRQLLAIQQTRRETGLS